MIYCKQCGRVIEDSSLKKCPKCNTTIGKGGRFCADCGKKLNPGEKCDCGTKSEKGVNNDVKNTEKCANNTIIPSEKCESEPKIEVKEVNNPVRQPINSRIAGNPLFEKIAQGDKNIEKSNKILQDEAVKIVYGKDMTVEKLIEQKNQEFQKQKELEEQKKQEEEKKVNEYVDQKQNSVNNIPQPVVQPINSVPNNTVQNYSQSANNGQNIYKPNNNGQNTADNVPQVTIKSVNPVQNNSNAYQSNNNGQGINSQVNSIGGGQKPNNTTVNQQPVIIRQNVTQQPIVSNVQQDNKQVINPVNSGQIANGSYQDAQSGNINNVSANDSKQVYTPAFNQNNMQYTNKTYDDMQHGPTSGPPKKIENYREKTFDGMWVAGLISSIASFFIYDKTLYYICITIAFVFGLLDILFNKKKTGIGVVLGSIVIMIMKILQNNGGV